MVHWAKKFRVFWATGDFDSFKLTTQWARAPNWWRIRQRSKQFWLVLGTQVLYLTAMIQTVGVLLSRRTIPTGVNLLSLTILGLTAFHVFIWEVEPRYALPLLPGLLLLGTLGGVRVPAWHVPVAGRQPLTFGLTVLVGVSLISLWQTSQSTRIKVVPVAVQGNGTYIQQRTQTLMPRAQLVATIPVASRNNQLRLKAFGRGGRVQIRLFKDGRLIKTWAGTPHALKKLRYPAQSAGRIRVTIRNLTQVPVRYGAMIAPYDPVTGHVTQRDHAYLQLNVENQLRQPQTLTSGWLCAVVMLIALIGGLVVIWTWPIRV